MTATAMPEAWGFDQILQNSSIKLVNASLTAWTSAPNESLAGLASMFAFGGLGIVFAMMVYVRTQKIIPTLFTMLFVTFGLQAFNLVDARLAWGTYIILIIGFALSVYNIYRTQK